MFKDAYGVLSTTLIQYSYNDKKLWVLDLSLAHKLMYDNYSVIPLHMSIWPFSGLHTIDV